MMIRHVIWISLIILTKIKRSHASVNGIYMSGRRRHATFQQQSSFVKAASHRRRRFLDHRRPAYASEKYLLASTEPQSVTVEDLGLIGKFVSGIVEVSLTGIMEYLSGFMGGYFLGTLFGVPGFLIRPLSKWGFLSLAFGGSKTFVKVLRNGKQDEWNTIISSMMGGAILRRKEGPKAMLQGAILYGMIIYLLNGSRGKKQEIFNYQDETLEF